MVRKQPEIIRKGNLISTFASITFRSQQQKSQTTQAVLFYLSSQSSINNNSGDILVQLQLWSVVYNAVTFRRCVFFGTNRIDILQSFGVFFFGGGGITSFTELWTLANRRSVLPATQSAGILYSAKASVNAVSLPHENEA